ncbi:transmembrane channel-like protein 4 [Liolophura sinensis]|uniref:transmembrane channel-like protein 4 n=1 Tax=Liolophura sinensis TaxID=3198878 RepID=UPI003159263C
MINGYHLDFAYLLILLTTYFGSFFIILRGIARATCLTVRGEDNTRLKFTTLLFATWDYNLTSRGAVYQASQSIINTCKDQMVEAKAHAAVFLRSRTEKTKVILLRILAWTITIILIGAGCTGIFFLVVNVNFADANHLGQISNATGINLSSGFFQVYGTTIIFSLINIIVPMVITRLPIMEHYSTGQWELRVTLVRVFFLRMANLIALMYSLYSTVQHLVDDSQTGDSSLGCVGTVLGQELYKLVIMDTLVHAIVNLSMYFGAYFWNRQKKELHLPSAILVIIYRQALIWVGRGHSFARSWSRHVHHLDSDIFSEAAIKDVTAELDSPGAGFPHGVQSDIPDPSQNKANADELVFSKQRQNRKKREKSKGLNLRSKMGFFNLVRHDFLVWWDRFSSRLWEVPVFRDVINKTETVFVN